MNRTLFSFASLACMAAGFAQPLFAQSSAAQPSLVQTVPSTAERDDATQPFDPYGTLPAAGAADDPKVPYASTSPADAAPARRLGTRQQTRGRLPGRTPLERIDSRIDNRIESRLDTRVGLEARALLDAAQKKRRADERSSAGGR